MISTIGQVAVILAALANGQADGEPTIGAAPDSGATTSQPTGDTASEKETQQAGISITETVVCVVAVVAFFLALYNAYAERRHRRLSVEPLVANGLVKSTSSPHVSVRFENKGLGPAVVKRFLVAWGTHVIPTNDNPTLIREIMATIQAFLIRVKYGKPRLDFTWLSEGAGLSAGEKINILSLENDQLKLSHSSEAEELARLFGHLRIRLEYQSMYGGKVYVSSVNDFDRPGQWNKTQDKTE